METARLVLERGGTVCIFPEGTRIRIGLAGAARSAASAGWRWRPARPSLPVAVHGTEQVRRGWRIRPRKVKVRLGRADDLPAHRAIPRRRSRNRSPPAIWPNDRAAVGVARRPAAAAQGRGDRRRQLGHRGRGAARPRRARGPARHPHRGEGGGDRPRRARTTRYLPGVPLPDSIDRQARRRHRARRRRPRLPRGAVGGAARRRSARSATGSAQRASVLLLTKGLVAPDGGSFPASTSASGSAPARSPRSAAPPTRARRLPGTAALVLGSRDADLRAQLGEVFDRAGLVCERSEDVVGVEMAGAAKNAAALAAAAAEAHGLNAAGIAAATIWRECVDVRARPRRRARDLRRARRGRRPDRDGDGAEGAATAAPASCSARASRPSRSRA